MKASYFNQLAKKEKFPKAFGDKYGTTPKDLYLIRVTSTWG
jgi:hypothetical protein